MSTEKDTVTKLPVPIAHTPPAMAALARTYLKSGEFLIIAATGDWLIVQDSDAVVLNGTRIVLV